MKKNISILGSTGSIGLTTLDIIDKKKEVFNVSLLYANQNIDLISKQIRKYKPNFFVIKNKNAYKKIKSKFKKNKTKILHSLESLKIKKKLDISISAIPGINGLKPTIKVIKNSKKVLIANKESIICGWDLIKKSLSKKTKLIPVDSEHFSIFKLLNNHKLEEINKIYITASGGPFLRYKKKQFKSITPNKALMHPKWKMGKKISIDSSTLMNKIFEVIEAHKLFDIPYEKLDILIHPQSLVHAIVEFKNGLTKFIYHETSMTVPLANAIFDDNLSIKDFLKVKTNKFSDKLTFEIVNPKIFPTIKLKKKLGKYPSTPIIINAANDILVNHFLKKRIDFLSIFKLIMSILSDSNYKKYAIRKPKNLNEIIEIDTWSRETILRKLKNINND